MSKKQLLLELFMPVMFMAISIYFIVESIPMGGEGVFPLICSVIQLTTAIYLLIKTLLKREITVKLDGLDAKKTLLTVVALVIYVLVLERIGYCISTFLLIVFIIWFLGYRNWKVTLPCAALTVAATFFIFDVLLNVPLPMLFFN